MLDTQAEQFLKGVAFGTILRVLDEEIASSKHSYAEEKRGENPSDLDLAYMRGEFEALERTKCRVSDEVASIISCPNES